MSLSFAAVGCAADPGDGGDTASAASDDPLVAGCSKELTFADVAFQTPTTWDVQRINGNDAVVGVPAGGPFDVELLVKSHYTGTVDALRPALCHFEGRPPSPPTSVRLLDSGFLPIGERTAEFRSWMLTCADTTARFHSAWLLPVSQIGIVEQVHHTSLVNERVVTNAAAAGDPPGAAAICSEPTKNLTFGKLTFRVPTTWDIATNGDVALVGVLNEGRANLRVRRHYTGTVGELQPTSCPREGQPPIAARSVVESEGGVLPIGNAGASYRRWTVTCADGVVEKHRAWVLRGHEIAVYELNDVKRNLSAVTFARVAP